jgi:hypothetical protein
MKTTDYLYAVASGVTAKFGVSLSKGAKTEESLVALALLKPTASRPMLKLGGYRDGSYSIPDDLEGITHCFSPGVGPSSAFESDLAERGMHVFMADASVEGPAANHPNFHFTRNHVASYSDPQKCLVSMDEWVSAKLGGVESGDLLLQMDIEGAEYEVIHAMSEALLQKFRIIAIEFHHLNQLRHGIMCSYMKSAVEKLLKHFKVCHSESNLAAGTFKVGSSRFSRLCEVSFIRKDRC